MKIQQNKFFLRRYLIMSEAEMELLVMLSETKLDLDTITATMMMIKQKEHGDILLREFLNNTDKKTLTRNTILRKVQEILK